ncbi:MAG: hypothetical protein ACXQTZ_01740 [Candidatus Alkanophagales archaeon]
MLWSRGDLKQRLLKVLRGVPSGKSVLLVGAELKKLAVDYIEEVLEEGEYVVYVTDYPCALEIENERCGVIQLYDVPPSGAEKFLRAQLVQPRLKTTSIVNLARVSVFIRDYFKEMMDEMASGMMRRRINLVVDNLVSMCAFTPLPEGLLRFLRLNIDMVKPFNAVGLYFLEREVSAMERLEALFEDGMIIRQGPRGLKVRG